MNEDQTQEIIDEDEEEEDLLFDMVLIIELNQLSNGKNEPFIAYRLPPQWTKDPYSKNVATFCFPDTTEFPISEMDSERFSFILTEDDGGRRFGYCLRRLPVGHGPRMPVCYVVLTYLPCYELYNKIIERIAYHYENSSSKLLTRFLESVIQNSFPKPGTSFSVEINDEHFENGTDTWRFTREENETPLNQFPIDHLLLSLSPDNILKIFASLLIERRVIFCAKKITLLSTIVQSMMALIHPFMWQHIFIPILPESLLTFCCAPMPFVVGILHSHLPQVLQLPLDEVLIIDIDKDTFIRTPEADPDHDVKLLPENIHANLLKPLVSTRKLIKKTSRRSKSRRVGKKSTTVPLELTKYVFEIQHAFLDFFVQLLGPAYRIHFTNEKKYSNDLYRQESPLEFQPLLEHFTCSQMFESFIRQQMITLNNRNSAFEKRIRVWLRVKNFQPINQSAPPSTPSKVQSADIASSIISPRASATAYASAPLSNEKSVENAEQSESKPRIVGSYIVESTQDRKQRITQIRSCSSAIVRANMKTPGGKALPPVPFRTRVHEDSRPLPPTPGDLTQSANLPNPSVTEDAPVNRSNMLHQSLQIPMYSPQSKDLPQPPQSGGAAPTISPRFVNRSKSPSNPAIAPVKSASRRERKDLSGGPPKLPGRAPLSESSPPPSLPPRPPESSHPRPQTFINMLPVTPNSPQRPQTVTNMNPVDPDASQPPSLPPTPPSKPRDLIFTPPSDQSDEESSTLPSLPPSPSPAPLLPQTPSPAPSLLQTPSPMPLTPSPISSLPPTPSSIPSTPSLPPTPSPIPSTPSLPPAGTPSISTESAADLKGPPQLPPKPRTFTDPPPMLISEPPAILVQQLQLSTNVPIQQISLDSLGFLDTNNITKVEVQKPIPPPISRPPQHLLDLLAQPTTMTPLRDMLPPSHFDNQLASQLGGLPSIPSNPLPVPPSSGLPSAPSSAPAPFSQFPSLAQNNPLPQMPRPPSQFTLPTTPPPLPNAQAGQPVFSLPTMYPTVPFTNPYSSNPTDNSAALQFNPQFQGNISLYPTGLSSSGFLPPSYILAQPIPPTPMQATESPFDPNATNLSAVLEPKSSSSSKSKRKKKKRVRVPKDKTELPAT